MTVLRRLGSPTSLLLGVAGLLAVAGISFAQSTGEMGMTYQRWADTLGSMTFAVAYCGPVAAAVPALTTARLCRPGAATGTGLGSRDRGRAAVTVTAVWAGFSCLAYLAGQVPLIVVTSGSATGSPAPYLPSVPVALVYLLALSVIGAAVGAATRSLPVIVAPLLAGGLAFVVNIPATNGVRPAWLLSPVRAPGRFVTTQPTPGYFILLVVAAGVLLAAAWFAVHRLLAVPVRSTAPVAGAAVAAVALLAGGGAAVAEPLTAAAPTPVCRDIAGLPVCLAPANEPLRELIAPGVASVLARYGPGERPVRELRDQNAATPTDTKDVLFIGVSRENDSTVPALLADSLAGTFACGQTSPPAAVATSLALGAWLREDVPGDGQIVTDDGTSQLSPGFGGPAPAEIPAEPNVAGSLEVPSLTDLSTVPVAEVQRLLRENREAVATCTFTLPAADGAGR
ncbi:hypothetical protein QDW14_07085 [Corynebacterium bovis]|uniref:hypothetical protein n=1 Tax=Corynebacterium bovis TaxID=36808 RepID=UPI002446BF5A|nr:hypothetical protein [Corynebacterium bovis]MDH2456236.1 hypothetical protein [Corynebacterium bovis]